MKRLSALNVGEILRRIIKNSARILKIKKSTASSGVRRGMLLNKGDPMKNDENSKNFFIKTGVSQAAWAKYEKDEAICLNDGKNDECSFKGKKEDCTFKGKQIIFKTGKANLEGKGFQILSWFDQMFKGGACAFLIPINP